MWLTTLGSKTLYIHIVQSSIVLISKKTTIILSRRGTLELRVHWLDLVSLTYDHDLRIWLPWLELYAKIQVCMSVLLTLKARHTLTDRGTTFTPDMSLTRDTKSSIRLNQNIALTFGLIGTTKILLLPSRPSVPMVDKSKSGFGFKSGFSHFSQIPRIWIWIGFVCF